jgi:hypothetical protein
MENEWFDHIREWTAKYAEETGEADLRDPYNIDKNILRHNGWDPDAYDPSMKPDLFRYLDMWYKLSEKTMPKPATAPKVITNSFSGDEGLGETALSNGWTVTSKPRDSFFISLAFNEQLNKEIYPLYSHSISELNINHYVLVDDIIAGVIK